MIVLYIILGIIIGVPAYLLLNTVLMLVGRLFAAMFEVLVPPLTISSFQNEIKGGPDSFAVGFGKWDKVFGWLFFLCIVIAFALGLIWRFSWLAYRVFRAWFKIIKFCWNLGARAKTKIKTETKTETK